MRSFPVIVAGISIWHRRMALKQTYVDAIPLRIGR